MTRQEMLSKTYQMMRKHGLNSWTFKEGTGKKRMGSASWPNRVLRISKYVLNSGDEEIFTEVLLHEIAHAIEFENFGFNGGGHGPRWRQTFIELGGTGDRLFPERFYKKLKIVSKYTLSCPKCKRTSKRDKVPNISRGRYVCSYCYKKKGESNSFIIRKNY